MWYFPYYLYILSIHYRVSIPFSVMFRFALFLMRELTTVTFHSYLLFRAAAVLIAAEWKKICDDCKLDILYSGWHITLHSVTVMTDRTLLKAYVSVRVVSRRCSVFERWRCFDALTQFVTSLQNLCKWLCRTAQIRFESLTCSLRHLTALKHKLAVTFPVKTRYYHRFHKPMLFNIAKILFFHSVMCLTHLAHVLV